MIDGICQTGPSIFTKRTLLVGTGLPIQYGSESIPILGTSEKHGIVDFGLTDVATCSRKDPHELRWLAGPLIFRWPIMMQQDRDCITYCLLNNKKHESWIASMKFPMATDHIDPHGLLHSCHFPKHRADARPSSAGTAAASDDGDNARGDGENSWDERQWMMIGALPARYFG